MTVSDRSFRGVRPDVSGERLAGLVAEAGHDVVHRCVVPDEPDGLAALLRRLADGEEASPPPDLVVTTGGTGVTPRDLTPEATAAACDRLVPGIAEAIRAASRDVTPMAMISRGVAGVRGRTLIVNMPGSPGGAADGWAV
ncbi:MAG: MogA/MoaB family molybdenum cofactor biosynthesis protein, partial [Actinomycetota bacterium]